MDAGRRDAGDERVAQGGIEVSGFVCVGPGCAPPRRPLRKQPLWSADAANLALWHSSVVQMSASPRVIRPRAWPDWSLRSARSTARCLSGVPGAGREPDATRESARARRRAITMIIRMRNHNKNERSGAE